MYTARTHVAEITKRNMSFCMFNIVITIKLCTEYYVDNDGRFFVRISFKKTVNKLEDSQEEYIKFLSEIEQKLDKHPDLKQQYIELMTKYEMLEHMLKIKNLEPNKLTYFLLYHVVFKQSTSKLYLIILLKLHQDYPLTIYDTIRFIFIDFVNINMSYRLITKKMYRQIFVNEENCLQRILWRSHKTEC